MDFASSIDGAVSSARFASEDLRSARIKSALNPAVMKNTEQSAMDEQLWKAAQGFEQIFLQSMMKQMRNTTFMAEDSLDSSNASQIYISMLDEEFTRIASEDRRFGIAKMIHGSLVKNLANSQLDPKGKTSKYRQNIPSPLNSKENSNKEEIL